jgi:hypothetical protein
MTKRSPFRYFKTSPEIIRLAVMLYVRFPLFLRNVEDLLHEAQEAAGRADDGCINAEGDAGKKKFLRPGARRRAVSWAMTQKGYR